MFKVGSQLREDHYLTLLDYVGKMEKPFLSNHTLNPANEYLYP